jgi:hypothetical protein
MIKKKLLSILTTLVLTASLSIPVYASDVDYAVVDVTPLTDSVTLADGGSSSITINITVTGKQDGTATFEVYKDWKLSNGVFVGSNPQEFTVGPRLIANAPATTFTTTGTLTVDSNVIENTYTLIAKVFNINNSNQNQTGAKLNIGKSSHYNVTVDNPEPPADTTAPEIASHENITKEATSSSGAAVTYTAPTAHDTVDGDVTASCSPDSGSTIALGDTTVTCTAADAHGNKAASTFTVTVQDTTAPKIASHENVTEEATSSLGATVTFTAPTAHDTVDGDVTVSCSPESGSTFALGDTIVTCSTADAHGNTATSTFTVTVQDTKAPVLTLPANTTVFATKAAGADVTLSATALDKVDGSVTVNCDHGSGSTFGIGTTTVTCTATDAHGNKATGSFTITVKYNFNGFFQPIDMGAINTVKAGSAVPVKFSLNGDLGLDIFATGYPKIVDAKFGPNVNYDEVESVVAATNSGLTYDNVTKTYTYVWKTDKSWTATGKQLIIKLKDGTTCTANFLFK